MCGTSQRDGKRKLEFANRSFFSFFLFFFLFFQQFVLLGFLGI